MKKFETQYLKTTSFCFPSQNHNHMPQRTKVFRETQFLITVCFPVIKFVNTSLVIMKLFLSLFFCFLTSYSMLNRIKFFVWKKCPFLIIRQSLHSMFLKVSYIMMSCLPERVYIPLEWAKIRGNPIFYSMTFLYFHI